MKNKVIATARSTVKKLLHIIGLDVVKTSTLLAFERTMAENTARFAANDAQITQLHNALEASNTLVVQRDATIDDLRKRITEGAAEIQKLHSSYLAKIEHLDAEIQDLSAIVADYQLKLERKPDYQIVMAQDQLRAGMVNLDPDFLELYVKCREYTMTSWERLYALYKAIYYIVENRIPGDIVECGVWRGGSMRLAAMTLLSLGINDRTLYLYDIFEGMTAPDAELDVDVHGNRAIDDWSQIKRRDVKWSYAPIEEVRQTIETTGYPMNRVELVKGPVEVTIPDAIPQRIALLRLDTDWYASTKHEIEHLYPLLSPQGVLALDDYGHYLARIIHGGVDFLEVSGD
jgi:Macrocin-O-methyltransferase (TylF)